MKTNSNKEEKMTLDDLTKGNIWTITPNELMQMLIEGQKDEAYKEMETHYMNIIRVVFDIQYLNRNNEKKIEQLESQHFEIYPYTSDGDIDAIAIRKKPIKKITDLNLENIQHLDASEVLDLIRRNMGTGWNGLSLSIQDIIESAFFVDSCTMPAATMHRAGGIIDSRREDGYEILELDRGGWIEGVFLKAKPKIEKVRMDFSIKDEDLDEDDLSNFADEEEDEEEDYPEEEDDSMDDDEDDGIDLDNATPEIEDIDIVEIDDEDEEKMF